MSLLTVEGLPPRSGIRIREGLRKSFTSFIVSFFFFLNICISQETNLKKLTSRKIKNQISKECDAINHNNSQGLWNVYKALHQVWPWNIEKGKHSLRP